MEIKTCYWQLKLLIGFCHRVLFKFNRNTKVFLKYIPRFALVWVVQFMTTQFKSSSGYEASVEPEEEWTIFISFWNIPTVREEHDSSVSSYHWSIN